MDQTAILVGCLVDVRFVLYLRMLHELGHSISGLR
jgi:hypothetical protein